MSTYFRIQPTTYNAEDLLNGAQTSASWNDIGNDDQARNGKSVCLSREDLAEYIAQSGICFESSWNLIELEGTPSADTDEDAHLGALLIHPTKIVAVTPIEDDFELEILAAYDELYAA